MSAAEAGTRPRTPSSAAGRRSCAAERFEWRAAPSTRFFGVADTDWARTGAAPNGFESSPGARRCFCGDCGTPMAYAADALPGETHFYAAARDHPERYAAQVHAPTAEQLSWLRIEDGPPRRQGSG